MNCREQAPKALLLSLLFAAACTDQRAVIRGLNIASNSDQIPAVTQGPTSTLVSWPAPRGDKAVSTTIRVKGTYDGKMLRYFGTEDLGYNDSDDHQPPLFELADGATLSNVI